MTIFGLFLALLNAVFCIHAIKTRQYAWSLLLALMFILIFVSVVMLEEAQ